MADNQTQQLASDDPWAVKARQLTATPDAQPAPQPSQGADLNDPWVAKAKQLQSGQAAQSSDPWQAKARDLGLSALGQVESGEESDRLGEDKSFLTRSLVTSAGKEFGYDIGEYRKGAGPIERGVEKFGSSLLSPVSLGLMLVTGGLGGIAEAGAATAGEEAALSLSGRAGAAALSKLAPDVAAKVVAASGVVSKLANAGFTAQQILGLADKVPQFTQAVRDGDNDKAMELATTGLLEGVAAKLSTSHLMRTFGEEPVWTGDKDVLAAGQRQEAIYGTKALEFRRANEALIKDKPRDMALQLYHEAGGDIAKLEQWRQEIVDDDRILPRMQEKYDALLKQAQSLSPEDQRLSAEIRADYATDLQTLKKYGKFHPNSPGQPNYAGQHRYVLDDEGASNVKQVGYRKFTKSPGFTKRRSFDTLVDAVKAGYEPAEIGLAGAREEYLRGVGGKVGAHEAELEGMRQKADDGRPVFIDPAKIRSIDGKDVVPVAPGAEIGEIGERRANLAERKRIDEMNPDEMRRELLTSKLGIPNRRAFDDAEDQGKANAYAHSDVSGLKALNDQYGYAAGDALLKAKADALKQAGLEAYHSQGDEFLFRGENRPDLTTKLEAARNLLKNTVFSYTRPDGVEVYFKGADFEYGTGLKPEQAEAELHRAKAARPPAAARGQMGGIVQTASGGKTASAQPGGKGEALPANKVTGSNLRPEDALRRVVGSDDINAIKAAVLKEGVSDLEIQNLRDAYKAGKEIAPIIVTRDAQGRVIPEGTDGLYRAYAAMLAGVERIPYVVRRLDANADLQDLGGFQAREFTGKWPSGLDPTTDKQIVGQAIADVTGNGGTKFDDLKPKMQGRVIRRALDLKAATQTSVSPGPTAVRQPSLQTTGTAKIIAKNGKLYYDVSDYRPGPDVFQKDRYRTTDKYGDPVFDRSNVMVHPDYHKSVMKAFDDSSWFRQTPIIRNLLGASTQSKKSLLSFSPFHFTTMYLRGVQMGLSPREALSPPELTSNSMAVQAKYPAMFSVANQRSLAAEGAAANTPLIHKIPGVGKFLASNEERLFGGGGYIDRLKAATYEKVVGQLTNRHPNWSSDQVQFASAKIVDSAFGGLNWKMLGRSMNGVDALRTIMLAPDFTGSQMLFGYYGLKPGGSVIGQSLARIALYNFGAARVLNMLTTGSPQLDHPFSVVSPDGKKTYSIRTMPADILHAMTDPRQFAYNRMNPLLMRTAFEGLTGRDEQGKRVTYQKELHDLLRNVLPISGQNIIPTFRREDEGIGTSVARGLGVGVEPNTSTAYKLAGRLASERSESGPVDEDKLDRHRFVLQMEDALRSGTIKPQDLNDAIQHGTLARDEVKQIWENFKETSQGTDGKPMNEYTARLYTRSKRLGMKDFLQVWDASSASEKKLLQPLFYKKGKEYLTKAQKSETPAALEKDSTYHRLWRDLRNQPLW